MQGDDAEERGRRYEREAEEQKYGDFRARRQAQSRKLLLLFLLGVGIIVAIAILTSLK